MRQTELQPSALKERRRIPKRGIRRIKKAFDSLALAHPDPNTTRLKGYDTLHRIWVGV